ncbi:unnamed protein product [Fusarium graminearum]|uniref:Chromosome 3, complete genome n=1 Tax=Gibberella zeae (strain ATCC MYA-4620 / CBS 123657 / FGSC 9075 / NRRL 31084 / PH-1) TaxID=229533 RepID=A0A098E481_GIBZE|nr:unnamed protein product [Fusarium graminearum]CZS84038.1 unnamed protein product [Fusarium graminearum]
MMGLRRFDDYVRLMTKGEGLGKLRRGGKSKLQLKMLRHSYIWLSLEMRKKEITCD